MQANSHYKSNWLTAKQIHGQQVSLFTDLPCSLHIRRPNKYTKAKLTKV